jgi:alpha-beta hydrolase superfamily lysophospholipase
MTEFQKNKIKRRPHKGWKVLQIIIIVYCSAGIALYYLQEKFLFHPVPLLPDYQFKFNIPFREVNIPLNTKDNLNVVQFFTQDSIPKGVVLYFHGNRDNVNHYARYAANFTKHGYEVWITDYPGYGKTTGKLTEANLYSQAKEVYKLANSKFEKNSIIVYGRSLGSGIASYLASKKPCRRLILETPYYSIPDLLGTYAPLYPVTAMSHFKLPTGEYLKEVNIPVTIFHGKADWIIPYRCAAKLKQLLKPGDEFITIDNGSHNDLDDFPLFHEKLDSILSQ